MSSEEIIPRWYAGMKKGHSNNKDVQIITIKEEGYSLERGEEKYYNKIKEKIFGEVLRLGKISKDKVRFDMQKFSFSYNAVKRKFQHIKRASGERYFQHQLRVVDYILYFSKNPTLRKILIALNHDTIEDTDISLNGLKEFCGEEEALGVQLISKDPFYTFIENQKDLDEFEKIKSAGIINKKNQPKDIFLFNKKVYLEKLTKKELDAYKEYKTLKEKYKEIKNKTFFSHMKDFDTFYNYALELQERHNISLQDNEIKELCLDTLEVKYWDRIDNLEDAEIYQDWNKKNLEKSKRKIQETKKYFYNISKSTHPYIYDIIVEKVEKAEDFIKNKFNENAGIEKRKTEVDDIIKK